jgi:asparagine synthase (glutamine-hydrolysing)
MCGFAGYVGAGSIQDLRAMTGALAHRGPDGEGEWLAETSPPVALGFRRLAILDIAGGAQPMATDDGALVVVFNGEIYNHRPLRAELESSGARFRSDHSDTEVLLHAYRQWGPAFVEKLNGMFAFVLFDRPGRRLLLARDRFGKKPLYYAEHAQGFVFASELRALARHRVIEKTIDTESVAHYFAFGYVPAPRSALRGVRKLRGGDLALYDVGTSRLTVSPYWRYRLRRPSRAGSMGDWASELRGLLRAAVARRLEADVPVGFFLSGGMDSASVLALAKERRPDGLQTFTIGFANAAFDERPAAQIAADYCGARHHTQVVDLAAMRTALDTVLTAIDEPIADPSLVPTYVLARFASETVRVALSGDGGDELLAGYETHRALASARVLDSVVPRFARPALLRAAIRLLPPSSGYLSTGFRLQRGLRGLAHEQPLWLAQWLAPAGLAEIGAACGRRVAAEDVYGDVLALWQSSASDLDLHERHLEFFAEFYLQSGVLAKVDRASMMNSLEVRSPFLDVEVAEFCLSLPRPAKFAQGRGKVVLRRAMDGLLPPPILARPKQGFAIPIQDWLRDLPAPSAADAEQLGLNGAWLAARWAEHRRGARDHRGLLFAWLCLDRWWGSLAARR